MPGAVLVLLWHQEELYLSAVGFPFVTNELGEVGLVFIQAEAVVFLFIQGAGEEVVPCVTAVLYLSVNMNLSTRLKGKRSVLVALNYVNLLVIKVIAF